MSTTSGTGCSPSPEAGGFWSAAELRSAMPVGPSSNRPLHVRLFPIRTAAITRLFLDELTAKHDVSDAEFPVDGAPWLKQHSIVPDSDFDASLVRIGTARHSAPLAAGVCDAGDSVERIFKE